MEFNIQNFLVILSVGLAILYLVRKYNPKNSFGAEIARSNRKECTDSGNYHSCAVSSPSPPRIDLRYLTNCRLYQSKSKKR